MKFTNALRIWNQSFDQEVKRHIRHTERAQNVKVQCRKGCHHCCDQIVTCSIWEALGIFQGLDEQTVAAIQPRLVEDAKILASGKVDHFEWAEMHRMCTFLKDGLCSIHDVRPWACRSYVSFDHPDKCIPVRGITRMLGTAGDLCAGYSIEVDKCGVQICGHNISNATAPMQYNLLVVMYLETLSDEECAREVQRLSKTHVLQIARSARIWEDVLPSEGCAKPSLPEVYPIWKHFEEKASTALNG